MKTTSEVLRTLGDEVRQLRIAEDLTQADVASRANVGVSTVHRLESGADVSLGTLIAVARVLDRLDWFDGFDPVGAGPSPMELLRERESRAARPQRVSRRRRDRA